MTKDSLNQPFTTKKLHTERDTGVEPVFSDWKSDVEPIN